MSYYRLFQVDIVQTSQLYLGGGINQPLPRLGDTLVADGSGGTLFSTLASGTLLQSTVTGLNSVVSSALVSTQQSLSTFSGYGLGVIANPFITTALLTSSIGGLGTAGYISGNTMTNYVVNAVTNLGATGYISSSQLVSSVTGLNSIIGQQVLTAQLTSTVNNLGNSYISSPALISTVTGFGQIYLSSPALLSAITNLGQTYISAADVVLARHLIVGVSTSSLTAQTAAAPTFFGSNIYTNTLAAGSIALSTSLTLTNAPLTMTYTAAVPTPAVLMNSATGNPMNFQMLAGTTNSLVLNVDGTSNAYILSQNPGSQITNPLTFGASYIQALTSSFTVTNTAGLTNNNTQILASTISTGVVQANFFVGDGSQLVNLPLLTLINVNSSISGYAPSFSTLSTQITSTLLNYGPSFSSLNSTLIGFGPSYSTLYAQLQTYTSSYAGPIMSTGVLTAAQVQTNSVNISSTTGAYWIATGAAATPQATVEYSLDGLNWTNAVAGGFSVQGNDVAFSGTLWVATGQDATAANTIQYSYDGQSWIQASGANFSVQGYGISWNGLIWVAVGQDATPANTIKYSPNGINWFNSSGTGFSIQGNFVSWNGRIWVAVGQDATTANAVQYSYDGINWTPANGPGYSASQYAVGWNGAFWLIGGLASGSSTLSYSKDGVNWSPIISPFQYSVNCIKWNGTYWAAVGQDTGASITRYSYDGLKWLNSAGIQFSAFGAAVDWNGSYWIATGQDSTQTALIKKSTDGINWINSATNNFTTIATDIAYSSNTTPSYQQSNFYIAPQSIPLPFLSTNQFFFTPDAMNVNNTLWINNKTNVMGVNCNAPSYTLDVYGNMNVSSVIYASSFIGDGALLRNTVLPTALFSTVAGLGTSGYISTAIDYSSLAISSALFFNSNIIASTVTGLQNRLLFTSTVYASTSFSTLNVIALNAISIQTSTITASTMNAILITASTGNFSSINVSSLVAPFTTAQVFLTSSIGFYAGDGYVVMPDVQHSNVSTITLYTSSLQANGLRTSNILLGSNWLQSPIQFYGRSGAYNNTAIVEQSTAQTSQELLLFRGSSTTDQVRIQTTGQFRLETGVSARLFPTTAQVATATMLVDINSNVAINGSQFYIAGAPTYNTIGVNTVTPLFSFDVNGTLRTFSAIISTAQISSASFNTIITPLASISALTVSSIPYVNASSVQTTALFTNYILASTVGAISGIFSSVIISSLLTVSSATINYALISTISVNTISAGVAYFGKLAASSLNVSTTLTTNVQTQALLTSSIGFYAGDGYLTIPDVQNSNVSTITLYTSSVQTNGLRTSNILIGSNWLQTPIQFYGRSGAFNNTAIVEQSTAQTSQELLLFRGSSTTDQVRIQTTGQFRLETGVSARLFPTTGQLATPVIYADVNSNVAINGTQFYITGLSNPYNYNAIGVNTATPLFNFDVNGTLRTFSAIISTAQISSASFNTIITPIASISALTVSSIPYVNASSVQTTALFTNYMLASTVGAISGIFSSVTISSLLTVSSATINYALISTISVNTISAGVAYIGNLAVSSLNVSSLVAPFTTAQAFLTSSIGFYAGDGYVVMPDVQNSNVSTIALYTSSLQANGLRTSNILIGSNWLQSPIQFYGRSGNFTNTAIVEQSTATTSQELLLFRGSSVTDQVRIQTTGAFRLETGVSARLFPTTAQQVTSVMYADANSNVTFNTNTLYIYGSATSSFVGINTVNPFFNLDVNGTIRTISSLTSTGIFYTLANTIGSISSLTVSSVALTVNFSTIQVNTLNASSLYTTYLTANSSIFSTAFISTSLFASTGIFNATLTNLGTFSTISSLVTSTGRIVAGQAIFSTLTVSSATFPFLAVQALQTSSLNFYSGDGIVTIPDLQSSNVSSIAMFASSMWANTILPSNIQVGRSFYQSPIQFFGRYGAYNNTVIAEQSTGLSTAELLIFRGSSIADQIRIQTTGAFRVETGVSGRLYPVSGQAPIPSMLIDTFGNVSFYGSSLYVSSSTAYVGINCNAPSFNLDVNGPIRTISSLTSTQTVYSLTNTVASISSLTVSSIALTVNFSTIQVNTLNASSLYTTYLTANSSIFSTAFISTSLFASTGIFNATLTNLGTFSTISSLVTSTGRIFAGQALISTANISTSVIAFLTAQSLQTSSLNFYTGDGFVSIPDLQTSNVSSVAMFASSVWANTILPSNIQVGRSFYQSPIQFFGRYGTYNNTVIAEQSTSISTGELLLFRGSSITDQIRIQTTGGFRIETGVSSRLFPIMGQLSTPAMLIDAYSNVTFNTNTLYINGPSSLVGINTSSPLYTLDVNGSFRTSTAQISTVIATSITTQALQTSSLNFYTGDGFVRIPDLQGSNVSSVAMFASSVWANTILPSNIQVGRSFYQSPIQFYGRYGTYNNTVIAEQSTGTATGELLLFRGSSISDQIRVQTTGVFRVETGVPGRLFPQMGQMSTPAMLIDTFSNVTFGSNALFVNQALNFVGINTSTPRATLDVNGSLRTSSLQTSSLNFYTGDGFVSIPDLQSSNVSSMALYTSSVVANTGLFATYVGINNNTPRYNLDVNGNARISSLTIGDVGTGVFTSTNTTFQLAVYGANGPARVGGTTWTQISDERIKTNISNADLDQCYEDIKSVSLRRFTYISTLFDTVPLADRNVLGFIAQEVKKLYPKAVVESPGFGIGDLNWLNIDQMNMSLYGAVKKVITLNECLTSTVSVLQEKISTLEGFGGNV